jgi:putative PEP-CTERM system histidine kinase
MSLLTTAGLACAAAFLPVSRLRRGAEPCAPLLATACLAIALWAALAALGPTGDGLSGWPAALWAAAGAALETLRSVALLLMLRSMRGRPLAREDAAWLGPLAVAAAALLALDLLGAAAARQGSHGLLQLAFAGHLALALAGLVAVENAWRSNPAERLWSLKFLLIALGTLFAYDFYLFADALLFARLDPGLAEARLLVTALAAPLLAISLLRPAQPLQLTLSRRAAFHSAAMVGGGLYLLTMGLAAYYVRSFGGGWGPAFQIAFLTAAAMLLAAVLASGRVRAAVKGAVARHFFAYRYDYREEWLRFIAAMADRQDEASLRDRVIKAIAAVLDSPGGVMWLWDEASASYGPAARWNFRAFDQREPGDGRLATFLTRRGAIVDLDQVARRDPGYAELACPEWLLLAPDAWVVVPLLHGEWLLGFILLQQARAPRGLNWEDHDLLRTIGRQAASFLAEQQASRALADARQLELFQRRFAFVAHDLKSVISQLSLLLANAEIHGRDRAFQADLIATVRDSVGTMQQMLSQLRGERRKAAPAETVDLVPTAQRLIEGRRAGPPVVLDCPMARLEVQGDQRRVGAVLGHLLSNACEAARDRVVVRLRLGPPEIGAVIEVEDDGPGMSADFIQDQLFRPFASTKEGGYGIGAYQCRELTRELNGQLTVWSTPGKGTRMRVTLPAADLRLAAVRPATRAVS